MKGTIKWFNKQKGFGFIEGEDGQEYFVHHTAVAQGVFLRDNDKVSFEPAQSDRGKQAQKVTLIEGEEREESDEETDEESEEE